MPAGQTDSLSDHVQLLHEDWRQTQNKEKKKVSTQQLLQQRCLSLLSIFVRSHTNIKALMKWALELPEKSGGNRGRK